MKTRAVLFAVLMTLIPAAAFAQAPPPPQRDEAPAQRAHKKQARKAKLKATLVARFDADGDGRLTGDERVQARAAVQQLRAERRARKIERMVRALQRFDANGDGWVDEAEIRAGARARPRARRSAE